jgi:hypothetical protein
VQVVRGEPSAARIRRQSRLTGAVAVALLLGTTAVAVLLAQRYHQNIPATLISLIFGLPGLYLAWVAYSSGQHAAENAEKVNLTVAGTADRLAVAQGKLWTQEASWRQLNMPYPLPVRWIPADPDLLDDWDTIGMLARTGVGWPARPTAGTWASGPAELAGCDDELASALARVPTGRLVVLGEPGAGKTTLMIRLVLDIIKQRASGDPVPVLVPVSSWDPKAQPLNKWLVGRLTLDHPWLADPAPPGSDEPTCAEALLAAHLIMPILDGLDEIADDARSAAISAINTGAMPGESFVITSRTALYREAARADRESEVTLQGAAGIELCPLDSGLVADYLLRGAAGPKARARWTHVLERLDERSELASALSTPLMVGLAQIIYNATGVNGAQPPDPNDLCLLCEMGNAAAIRRHLLAGFVAAAYRPRGFGPSDQPHQWAPPKAEKTLQFLAHYLQSTIQSPDLAWWQLNMAAPSVVNVGLGLTGGLACALLGGLLGGPPVGIAAGVAGWLITIAMIGIFGVGRRWTELSYSYPRHSAGQKVVARVLAPLCGMLFFGFLILALALALGLLAVTVGGLTGRIALGLLGGMAGGLTAGFLAAVGGGRDPDAPGTIRWRSRGSTLGASLALVLACGLVGSLAVSVWFGLTVGMASGMLTAVAGGLISGPSASASVAGADAALARARRAALLTAAVAGIPIGLLAGLAVWLAGGRGYGLISGTAAVLAAWLVCSPAANTWLAWEIVRGWLAARRRVPWRLMAFLRDAYNRGVLRQSGSVYQFRHIELQRSLARRYGKRAERAI